MMEKSSLHIAYTDIHTVIRKQTFFIYNCPKILVSLDLYLYKSVMNIHIINPQS